MGISVYDGAMLVGLARTQAQKGTAVCLGMPTVRFNPRQLKTWCARAGVDWQVPDDLDPKKPMSPSSFFHMLGYKRFLAMDVSAYEGAQIIHDLNSATPPADFAGCADLVLDAGTLEHVFDVPAALRTVGSLLNTGGMAVHLTPCNGYLDHGFYQVCPTLFYDYYVANGYRIVSANILNRHPRIECQPYVEDVYRARGFAYGIDEMPRSTNFFAAAKTTASTVDRVPTQSYYRAKHTGAAQHYATDIAFTFKYTPSKLRRIAGEALRRLRG